MRFRGAGLYAPNGVAVARYESVNMAIEIDPEGFQKAREWQCF